MTYQFIRQILTVLYAPIQWFIIIIVHISPLAHISCVLLGESSVGYNFSRSAITSHFRVICSHSGMLYKTKNECTEVDNVKSIFEVSA